MKEKIICIVGPTASGKTGLGIALAKAIDAEIISADSMQIYRGLDIATAKVTKEEMQGIPHHMIDICNKDEKFSVADFKIMCYDKIQEILARGKKVIIVGGTGLYVTATVENMNFIEEEVDESYRKSLEALAQEKSKEELHQMLAKIDPDSAKQIHPNNVKRVIRAMEMANRNIIKSDHMQAEQKRKQEEESPYDFYVFCIEQPRDILYNRINTRVDLMVEQGILQEAKQVWESQLDPNTTCMQAIGYKEFFPYFRGESDLKSCIDTLKQETRKYAKRQMTWFRHKLHPYYLEGVKEKSELVKEIIEKINN